MLGVLHGHVGLADQRGDFPRIIRPQADANGRTDHQLLIADRHRYPQLGQQTTGHARQAGKTTVGVEQHPELVTRQARQGVGLGYRLAQATAHLAQQLIGHVMAEAVIQQFEAIQIDV